MDTVLMVAEKPSLSSAIANILSEGKVSILSLSLLSLSIVVRFECCLAGRE